MTRSTSMAYLSVDGTAALKASRVRPVLTLIEGGASRTPRTRVSSRGVLSSKQMALVSLVGIALICVLGFASLVVDTLSSASVQEALDSAGVVSVTVSEGDTLWSIAQAHCPEGVGTSELVRWIESENDLTSKTIVPGQVLLVPAGAHF